MRKRERERIYNLDLGNYKVDIEGYIKMPKGLYINTGRFPDRCRFPSGCEFRGHLEFGIDTVFSEPIELSEDSIYCGFYNEQVKQALTIQIIGGDKITFYKHKNGGIVPDNMRYRIVNGELRAVYEKVPAYIIDEIADYFRD